MHEFIDCQGLGGAWTLGTVRTGRFELIHRASLQGGFGDETVDMNRHLLGDRWRQDPGGSPDEWTPVQAAYLCGTPPCSGFSNLNTRMERGPGAPINRCMHALIEYAGECIGTDSRRGPQVVAFESVQGAYTKGRVLMQALRAKLEDITNEAYDLHNVLMSGATVGSAQFRHRYYPVFSRVPFGIDKPRASDLPDGRPATYYDAIGDLQGLSLQWEKQRRTYGPPSEYARKLIDTIDIAQHMAAEGRVADAVHEVCLRGWGNGKYLSEAFDAVNYHPPEYTKQRREKGIRRGASTYAGLNWPLRIQPDKPGYVLTGGCARDFVHWAEPRLLTIRELSRLMGYPDSWRWPQSITKAGMQIGKCCPCQSGQWISTWVANALEGEPGRRGELIGEDEFYYNFTSLYKKWM